MKAFKYILMLVAVTIIITGLIHYIGFEETVIGVLIWLIVENVTAKKCNR